MIQFEYNGNDIRVDIGDHVEYIGISVYVNEDYIDSFTSDDSMTNLVNKICINPFSVTELESLILKGVN